MYKDAGAGSAMKLSETIVGASARETASDLKPHRNKPRGNDNQFQVSHHVSIQITTTAKNQIRRGGNIESLDLMADGPQ